MITRSPTRGFYDVIIVGSGPSGASYARTIATLRPHTTILMLESGPIVSTPPGHHVRAIRDLDLRFAAQLASQGPENKPTDTEERRRRAESVSTGRQAAVLARPGTWLIGDGASQPGEDGMPAAALSSAVGGMGVHWTGACPTPGTGEWIDDLDRAELMGAFASARKLLAVTADAFAAAPLGEEVRRALGAKYDKGRETDRRVQAMPMAVHIDEDGRRYWSGSDIILGDMMSSSLFDLQPMTTALALTPSNSGFTVLAHDREAGRTFEIGAQTVVVAADPFRTPQLLHASGIRPNALGHYLNDQPQVGGTIRLRRSMGGDHVGLAKMYDGSVDRLSGVSWVPYDAVQFPYHGQIMQLDASPVAVDPTYETWPGSIVECGLFGTKDLQFDDRLEFDDTVADTFGMPGIKIHYRLTPNDHETIANMVTEVGKMSEILGEPVNDEPPVVFPNGSSIHYQGTVRLGLVDDGTSVCDTDMQVWGTPGLYLGGNGVIPTPTACNPTLTNVALSVIGARAITRRLE